jgi:Second Messenger Oligonucleotide or Dinucleotide Synthetase domain
MKQHGQYKTMIERKKRCVTITYANDFHLDILPAKPDGAAGEECVVVPDRKLECWVASNPRGYAQWFLSRTAVGRMHLLDKAAAAAPIPAQEAAEHKPTLKLAVQLWKRWRDVKYGTSDLSPRSIILTTLAANNYRGEASVSDAFIAILQGVSSSVPNVGRLIVRNPKNQNEDFSESWNDQPKYDAFLAGLRELNSDMQKLLLLHGPELARKLESMFGEYVKSAFEKQANARGAHFE